MAKTDIESAFRLLPVHPDSLYLLGCFFEGGYYVDRCLPMGCSISCAYFEAFSSFLEWVVKERAGMGSVTHYLDDFLCVGPAGTRICHLLLSTMLDVFGVFGVPVAHDKTEGPATVMKFLGIEIDTVGRLCRLPRDKIEDLVGGLEGALGVKKVTLVQLQSLLGKLNFACRVLPMGRVFTRRLSIATAGVREPHHFISIKEKQALNPLKNNSDITIKPADKGGAIVIMNSSDYHEEIMSQLTDRTVYVPTPQDPTTQIKALIDSTINSAHKASLSMTKQRHF
ncbi:uncharacterized protein PAF06_018723 [Gastrophryne carolinensis]